MGPTAPKQSFTNRSKIEIIVSLLTHAGSGSRKTKLIYKCNLSLAQFNKYVDCLIEGELLQKNVQTSRGGKNYEVYQATEQGAEFLKDYAKLSNPRVTNLKNSF